MDTIVARPNFIDPTPQQVLYYQLEFCLEPQKPQLEAHTWIKLLELPSPYSYEEALLLCELSPDEWLAWIPDHGEAVLKILTCDRVANNP